MAKTTGKGVLSSGDQKRMADYRAKRAGKGASKVAKAKPRGKDAGTSPARGQADPRSAYVDYTPPRGKSKSAKAKKKKPNAQKVVGEYKKGKRTTFLKKLVSYLD